MEDGGTWDLQGEALRAELHRYFNSPLWIPDEPVTNTLGVPGRVIPKLMVALFGRADVGGFEGWQVYRRAVLYRCNECNLKFYPVGGRTAREWPEAIRELLGQDIAAYREECRMSRPKVIRMEKPQAFDGTQLHIILAALPEWQTVLDFEKPASRCIEEAKDSRGNTIFRLFKRDGTVSYAYFNMFRRGIRNAEIKEFTQALVPLIPKSVRERVDLRMLERLAS
jgi:hypothetical protein